MVTVLYVLLGIMGLAIFDGCCGPHERTKLAHKGGTIRNSPVAAFDSRPSTRRKSPG
jgi:hypothetical protein